MGKRFIFILMACSLLSIATVVHAQHIDKQTYTFAIKKADTLKLDKYVMIDQIQGTQSKPVILFAFGGGFKGGRRDNPDYISYFHFLARAGYVVVSTDYRTQLKDIDKSEYSDLQGFSSALQQAITCAVEDFGDATNYIIEHSVEWQINPAQIIACGSSAGAITALQAEYEICNQTAFADRLPANFNYAGVISFSGAICANGIPKWIMSPCPLMLFHGDADSTVPFTKAVVEEMGLWGSNFICMQLKEKETAYYFYIAEGIGHSLSYSPMKDNRHDILSFLNRLVLGKEKRCITTVEKNPEISRYKSDFTIEDYIRENMRKTLVVIENKPRFDRRHRYIGRYGMTAQNDRSVGNPRDKLYGNAFRRRKFGDRRVVASRTVDAEYEFLMIFRALKHPLDYKLVKLVERSGFVVKSVAAVRFYSVFRKKSVGRAF